MQTDPRDRDDAAREHDAGADDDIRRVEGMSEDRREVPVERRAGGWSQKSHGDIAAERSDEEAEEAAERRRNPIESEPREYPESIEAPGTGIGSGPSYDPARDTAEMRSGSGASSDLGRREGYPMEEVGPGGFSAPSARSQGGTQDRVDPAASPGGAPQGAKAKGGKRPAPRRPASEKKRGKTRGG